jgi:hypothetical protein
MVVVIELWTLENRTNCLWESYQRAKKTLSSVWSSFAVPSAMQSAVASTDLSDVEHTRCEWLACESARLLVGGMNKGKDKRNGRSPKRPTICSRSRLLSIPRRRFDPRLLSLLHPGCINLTDLEGASSSTHFARDSIDIFKFLKIVSRCSLVLFSLSFSFPFSLRSVLFSSTLFVPSVNCLNW